MNKKPILYEELVSSNRSNIQQPEFVKRMLVRGVFEEFETQIQYDKGGMVQKRIFKLENSGFFNEYFHG